MPSRIADYSGITFSPAERDFAALNLLICGKLENRSIWKEPHGRRARRYYVESDNSFTGIAPVEKILVEQ